MTVPILLALTRDNPDLKLVALTKPSHQPILRRLPGVEFITPDLNSRHKGLAGLFRLSREIRNYGVDLHADLHNVIRSKVLRWMTPDIPSKTVDKGRREKKSVIHRSDRNADLPSTHQRYAQVFRELGFKLELTGSEYLPRYSFDSIPEPIRVLSGERPWVIFAPFAAHWGKSLSRKRTRQHISELCKMDLELFLIGGPKESAFFIKEAAEHVNCHNIAAKFTLEEELAIISHASAMISMDSANGHMAAMFGVPVITLWGVTHPVTGFAPFGQPWKNQLFPDYNKYPAVPTSVYGNKCPLDYKDAVDSISSDVLCDRVGEVVNTSIQ